MSEGQAYICDGRIPRIESLSLAPREAEALVIYCVIDDILSLLPHYLRLHLLALATRHLG